MIRHIAVICLLAVACLTPRASGQSAEEGIAMAVQGRRWSTEKANQWYRKQTWLVGCNFIPSTAINQLEMWQADTFDRETIDRELGWASNLGMNVVRVYLHDLAYDQDPEGFLDRINGFLRIADSHGIKTLFVIFDDCWLDEPKPGKQPKPWPGVHNSGWLESPGLSQLECYPNDPNLRRRLKIYVQAVMSRFAEDRRVLMWDLYNEPGGWWYRRGETPDSFKKGLTDDLCLPLLRDVYLWAREVNPSQPLTSCWNRGAFEVEAALKRADVVTFHHYGNPESLEDLIQKLQQSAPGRPMICTEYLARGTGSTFKGCLPVFEKHRIGAINWGLVSGKTNTIWNWDSWNHPGGEEPEVWHHDVFRKNGSPHDESEITLIRSITNQARAVQHDKTTDQSLVHPKGRIEIDDFDSIKLYTLKNDAGMTVKVTNYGAIITSIVVPDREGKLADIALGYNRVEDYINAVDKPYFGAIVGRYGNRIARGQFKINGETYTLAKNNGKNHLHGGIIGFDKVIWEAEVDEANNAIKLSYLAKDKEEGYPGNLQVTVVYQLTNNNELIITYHAVTDKTTPINLTQHTYFNLKGEGNGTILDHELMLNAEQYTPVDEGLIPTGEIASVVGTPFDFSTAKPIGQDIEQNNEQLRFGGGYDHNWVLNKSTKDSELTLAAKVFEPTTGRVMKVYTTEPGVQFYCGNFLDGRLQGKAGKTYVYRAGFCLETQHFPDSPNQPEFPSTLLIPESEYRSKTKISFTAK